MRVAGALAIGAAGLAFSPVALGAASSLNVSGPTHVTLGHRFQLVVAGVNAHPADRVVAFEDIPAKRCASTVLAEDARVESVVVGGPWSLSTTGKHFAESVALRASRAGGHVLCAYLYSSHNERTAATASHRWTNVT
jgi:hypothetical protein